MIAALDKLRHLVAGDLVDELILRTENPERVGRELADAGAHVVREVRAVEVQRRGFRYGFRAGMYLLGGTPITVTSAERPLGRATREDLDSPSPFELGAEGG